MPTVAIIGSFRQHMDHVSEARRRLSDAGWIVVSPLSDAVEEPATSFVRFDTDDAEHDDATVQAIALHRILGADMVYVCAPDGYVGRTTCLELGWIISRDRALYFSERPRDLPIHVPTDAILPIEDLAGLADFSPQRFHRCEHGLGHDLQHDLVRDRLRDV